jgi:hypothetical protein
MGIRSNYATDRKRRNRRRRNRRRYKRTQRRTDLRNAFVAWGRRTRRTRRRLKKRRVRIKPRSRRNAGQRTWGQNLLRDVFVDTILKGWKNLPKSELDRRRKGYGRSAVHARKRDRAVRRIPRLLRRVEAAQRRRRTSAKRRRATQKTNRRSAAFDQMARSGRTANTV